MAGRKASITDKDVARAATRLISQGKRPTVDAVHEEVGRRGSRTTVNNLLRAFLDEFGKQGLRALPSAIPEALVPIIEDFWAQALVKASERYDEDRQDWDREMDALKAQVAAKETVIGERDALLMDREQYIDQQSRLLEDRLGEIRQFKQIHQANEVVIDDLKRDKTRLTQQLAQERDQAQQRYDQAQEDWARERAILERAAEDARNQLAEDNEKNLRLADHWMLQLDDARQHVTELKERHQEDRKRWEGDMRLEKARADRLSGTVSEYERKVADLEAKLEASVESESRLKQDYEALERRVEEQQRLIEQLEQKLPSGTDQSS